MYLKNTHLALFNFVTFGFLFPYFCANKTLFLFAYLVVMNSTKRRGDRLKFKGWMVIGSNQYGHSYLLIYD